MDRYTFGNYEEFLMGECRLHDIPGKCSSLITEEQGIVDKYESIIDELYYAVSKEKALPYDDDFSYLVYNLGNYRMKQNCFIQDVTLLVFAGHKGHNFDGSEFKPKETTKITKSYRLSDFYIFIGIDDNDINSKNGKKQFYYELSHELQHAYRTYCILLTNDSDAIDGEKRVKERYGNSIKMYGKNDDNRLRNLVSRLYYVSEKDEISSEINRLFEYIRQNEEINSNNYREYIDNMPLYISIKELDRFSQIMKKNENDSDFVEFVGGIFGIISNKENENKSKLYVEFMTRLSFNGSWALRKFYKCLYNAFEKFGRIVPRTINRNVNERMFDFDVMEEIEKIKDSLNKQL